MKILMVSMFSLHFFRWAEQLKGSGHEIFWLDVFDSRTHVKEISFVNQISGWRYKWDFPFRYSIKRNLPTLNRFLNNLNERRLEKVFEQKLKTIKPDVVHSFVMYSACVPICEVMNRNPDIKWVYSAWGNDLFYYQRVTSYLKDIKKVLPRVDFMFADCKRDFEIAKSYDFIGKFLGAYPGGGGYDLKKYNQFVKPLKERSTILIKGYQHLFGRCNNILEALLEIQEDLKGYNLVVFAANKEVKTFVKRPEFANFHNLEVRGVVNQEEVMRLMGEAILYIGNSISDGTPNTFLEAIVMEAFPIQSDPGGATSETIKDKFNGLLIEDPEDPSAIASTIKVALQNLKMVQAGVEFNNHNLKPRLERHYIREQVLEAYKLVEDSLTEIKKC